MSTGTKKASAGEQGRHEKAVTKSITDGNGNENRVLENYWTIAVGGGAKSEEWLNRPFNSAIRLIDFIAGCTTRADITAAEYDEFKKQHTAAKSEYRAAVKANAKEAPWIKQRMLKLQRDLFKAKDGPGFIGRSHFSGGPKTAENVAGRSVLALDIDNGDENTLHALLDRMDALCISYLIYSTFSHRPGRVYRYRVVIPLNREITDKTEYNAVIRSFAARIDNPAGSTWFDGSTFEWGRMNYLPRYCKDIQPEIEVCDWCPELDVDALLAAVDWDNLPRFGEDDSPAVSVGSNGNWTHPEDSTFEPARVLHELYPDIRDFIDMHMTDVYIEEEPGEYSYASGESGLLKIYEEGACAFYHGNSDPAGLDAYGVRHRVGPYDMILAHKAGGDAARANEWIAASIPEYQATRARLAFEPIPEEAHQVETGGRFKLSTFYEVMNAEPPTWQVDGLLPEKALCAIYSPPASYKSFVALSLALSVAYGLPWMGREVKQGGALYIAAEGQGGLGKRMKAWHIHNGIPEDPAAPTYMLGSAVNFISSQDVNDLIASIPLGGNISLVVVDTLNRSMAGGDENSAKDIAQFVDGCTKLQQALGATVVIVHHSGKDQTKGMRGSTAILGAMDTVLRVDRTSSGVTLKCEKQKDFEQFEDIRLRAVQVEEAESMTLEFVSTAFNAFDDNEQGLSPSESKILAVIEENEDGLEQKAITGFTGLHRNSVSNGIKTLKDLGLIRKEGTKYLAGTDDEE